MIEEVFSFFTSDLVSQTTIKHLVIESIFSLLILWLIFSLKKSKKKDITLTENEKEFLINEFEPEPMIPEDPKPLALKSRTVSGKGSKFVNVDGYDCLNFAAHNYLGFIGNKSIEEKAIESVTQYGVGSCGPRGFYGTSEVHLELEQKLAEYMGYEDAIVYSYAFSTISSAIPAYAKRSDVIFVDEKANFAIQKGCDASRSKIKYFKHNDMADLRRVLEQNCRPTSKGPFNLFQGPSARARHFLVVEGIYANSGQICPLPELVELRKEFKLRLFIDESISFGVLGETGKGVTEYYNVDRNVHVDLIMASLEYSLGSIGGFCVGPASIVDNQRLSGLGYCFSASLPPLLVVAAMEALAEIKRSPGVLTRLRQMCNEMHQLLNSSEVITRHFDVSGDCDSPVHLLFLKPHADVNNTAESLEDVIDFCHLRGVAICRMAFLDSDAARLIECIRITTCNFLTSEDLAKLISTLENALDSIFTVS